MDSIFTDEKMRVGSHTAKAGCLINVRARNADFGLFDSHTQACYSLLFSSLSNSPGGVKV